MAEIEYEGDYYEGYEGHVGFALEAAPLSSVAAELTASPTLAALGYASSPEVKTPNNPMPVEGVGAAIPFGFKGKRREPYAKGSFLLTSATTGKKLIQAASRYSPDSAIPAAGRNKQGLGLVTLGGGIAGADASHRTLWQTRFGLLSMLSISAAMDELVRVEYEVKALTAVKSSVVAPFTDVQIAAAGGTPYTMDECWMEYEDDTNTIDFSSIVENLRLNIANVINYRLIRHPHADGDIHPLTRAARYLTAGKETSGIELGLADEVPNIPGTLNVRFSNGAGQVNCSIIGIELNENTMNEATPDSQFSFGTGLVSRQILIT